MKRNLKFMLTLLTLVFAIGITFAQEKVISGTVTDQGGIALPGVNVVVKGTTKGTQTDFDGKYSIKANVGQTLVFSYIGMKTTEQRVGNSSTINLLMEEDAESLEEVVISVPYGTVKKEAFVGSAGLVKASDIEGRSLTNVAQALEGASPGIQFTPSSGQPGEAPSIRIRGIGSVTTSNAPLYIVDGAIFTGDLSSLNSNDIENITVLKDASSTSLYGSGASNGVIMITTKKGRSGKDRINLDVSQGISQRSLNEYPRLNAQQYYPMMWEAYRNSLSISGNTPEATANQTATDGIYNLLGKYNPFNVANNAIVGTDGTLNPNAQLIYTDLDWQKELFKTGYRSNVDFSYSGANDKTDYFASINYLNESAYVINSDFERVTARANINSKPKDWIKTGLNISASSTASNQAVDGASSSTSFVNPFRTTRVMAPIYPVYLHDPVTGDFILDDAGNRIYDVGDIRPQSPGRHVVQENLLNQDLNKILNVNGRIYADFYFLNDFTFTTSLSIDSRNYNNYSYTNKIVGDAAPAGSYSRTTNTILGLTFNQVLNYNKTFGDHNVSALVGHENFRYDWDYFSGTKNGQVIDGIYELINFVNIRDLDGYSRELRKESYFSRANYDYASKYYLSGSVRRDGSSRFSQDVRWGTFWSAGAAWRISQENFMNDIDFIDELKLRTSYGQVGNDSNLSHSSLSFYVYQSLYGLGYNNADQAGLLISAPGNPQLTWESNNQFDVALEFTLLNNRFSGSAEYYKRETKNLIFDVPLPVSSGLDDFPDNIGDMYNEGLEFTLNTSILKKSAFKWDLSVNASTIKNKITRLPQEEIISGSKKLAVGTSIYEYWLRQWAGVDSADGSSLYIPTEEAITTNNSSIREIDGVKYTTNQNEAEYGFFGSALPDVYGSFSNTFEYKGLRLSTLFTYQLGGKTYDTNYAAIMSAGLPGTAWSTDILNRWQKPGDITNVPRVDINRTTEFDAGSSRWLVDSDYLALRQVSLSYNFPEAITSPIGVNNLRVYINAENLFSITARKGLEPSQNFNGTTQNRSVPARILTMGINLGF